MTAAQVHLAFNHFPIAGMIFAFIVLLWGVFAKHDVIKTVGIVIVIISALTALIVASSGDGAEEIVEHKPLVTKHIIHEHEEAADTAAIAIYLTAVLGIAWIVMNKKKINHQEKVFGLLLFANFISAAFIADAAHKGGQIRHDEIRFEESSEEKSR